MFGLFDVSLVNLRRALLLLAVLIVAGCGSADDRAQSYYERGVKLLSQQDYARASIAFKNAMQLKKNFVGAWRGLAQIEEHNRNWESLTSIWRTIVDLDSKDIDAKVRLARLLVLTNALDDALNVIKVAEELDQRNTTVLGIKA